MGKRKEIQNLIGNAFFSQVVFQMYFSNFC